MEPISRRIFLASTCMAFGLPVSLAAQQSGQTSTFDLGTLVVETPGEETSAGPVDGLRALTSDSATGTRTPLREVPQSVAVVPRSVIDRQAAQSVSDALRNVANVQANDQRSTPAFDNTLLRGFAAERYRDGFTTNQYAPGDRESLIDVERIEVLKGPSAILFGGGSGAPAGGIVNIVSKKPEAEAARSVGLRVDTDGLLSPFFDVNQPLSETVRFRFVGEYATQRFDVDVLEAERFTLAPSVAFDWGATTLLVQGRYSEWSQPEYQGLPATGTVAGAFRIDPDLFIGPADIEDSGSQAASLGATLEHRFSDIWSAKATLRWSASDFDEHVQSLVGADGFAADTPFAAPSTWALANGRLAQEQDELSFAASAKAEFAWGRSVNTLLFGADYSALDDEGFIAVAFAPATVDLTAPVFSAPYTRPGTGLNDQFVENRTAGAYAQWQSSIDDRWHLLGSLRLAHVEVDFRNALGAERTAETRLLPRFGAVYDVTDQLSVFASYGEGMRGQPFQLFSGKARPEMSRQIEAGMKFDTDFGLAGTVALFEIERENVAVTDPATFQSRAEGRQRARGIEADLTWRLGPQLSALLSYAYVDAEFTRDAPTATGVIPAGNALPGVPRHSGRVWLDYQFAGRWDGLSLGGGVYAQSGEYLSNNNLYKSDAFYTLDAALTYARGGYRASLGIQNLTDTDYFDRYGYFGGRVAPGAGRKLTAALEIQF
ncbi:TonB-dependent siderophore receptor [Roseovarius aquimarinus]|uniref:TonB-dependent siderophore receptor n=1 Tax=Roseovarius aquimarinus TaxID=1229156 RepID=A0ABW7ID83_9RHOB